MTGDMRERWRGLNVLDVTDWNTSARNPEINGRTWYACASLSSDLGCEDTRARG